MAIRTYIAIATAALLMGSAELAVAQSGGDSEHADANNRVCHNVALSERDRAACTRELAAARTDADRTKVRKSYESKIAETREQKNSR